MDDKRLIRRSSKALKHSGIPDPIRQRMSETARQVGLDAMASTMGLKRVSLLPPGMSVSAEGLRSMARYPIFAPMTSAEREAGMTQQTLEIIQQVSIDTAVEVETRLIPRFNEQARTGSKAIWIAIALGVPSLVVGLVALVLTLGHS